MIVNWQYLDVYIIYVCFLPPLLPMCSNFFSDMSVAVGNWKSCDSVLYISEGAVCLQRAIHVLASDERLSSAREQLKPKGIFPLNKTEVEYIVQCSCIYTVLHPKPPMVNQIKYLLCT